LGVPLARMGRVGRFISLSTSSKIYSRMKNGFALVKEIIYQDTVQCKRV
jgi:hypothetical protein